MGSKNQLKLIILLGLIVLMPSAVDAAQSITLNGCSSNFPAINARTPILTCFGGQGNDWHTSDCALWQNYPSASPFCDGRITGLSGIPVRYDGYRATLSWNIRGEALMSVVSDSERLAKQTYEFLRPFYQMGSQVMSYIGTGSAGHGTGGSSGSMDVTNLVKKGYYNGLVVKMIPRSADTDNHWSGTGGTITLTIEDGQPPPSQTPPPPPPPPTLTFAADKTSLSFGESTVLRWVSQSANSCSASGDWSGSKPIAGAEGTGNLSLSKTYNLICLGAGGSISKTVNINVSAPPVSADIKANNSNGPVPLNFNESATISWTSVYSQFPQYNGSCSVSKDGISFGSGTSGSQSTGNLTPGGARTYSVSCSGALGSVSDSVVVDVADPYLSVVINAIPLPPAGTASSYTTTLTSNVGGTAIGTINYSLWWNCNNSTASVGTASSACGALPATTVGNCAENSNGVKCEAVSSPSLSRPHTFTCPAGGGACSFKPKVITERFGLSATDDLSAGFGCGGACAGVGTGPGGGGGGAGGGGSGGSGAGSGIGGVISSLITILEPPRYFTLSKSGNLEAGVSVNPIANSNKIQITVNPFNLYSADTRLEVIDMPAGSSAHFGTSGASGANLSAPYPKSVDFWITIPRATVVGNHTIKVRGTGGGVSDTIEILLNVIQRQPEFREI